MQYCALNTSTKSRLVQKLSGFSGKFVLGNYPAVVVGTSMHTSNPYSYKIEAIAGCIPYSIHHSL